MANETTNPVNTANAPRIDNAPMKNVSIEEQEKMDAKREERKLNRITTIANLVMTAGAGIGHFIEKMTDMDNSFSTMVIEKNPELYSKMLDIGDKVHERLVKYQEGFDGLFVGFMNAQTTAVVELIKPVVHKLDFQPLVEAQAKLVVAQAAAMEAHSDISDEFHKMHKLLAAQGETIESLRRLEQSNKDSIEAVKKGTGNK